jgi:hypothetical protein
MVRTMMMRETITTTTSHDDDPVRQFQNFTINPLYKRRNGVPSQDVVEDIAATYGALSVTRMNRMF